MHPITVHQWVVYGVIVWACLMLVALTINRNGAEYDRAFESHEPIRLGNRFANYAARIAQLATRATHRVFK